MRITKVYTRTGDRGTTRLVGGQVTPKHHPRIEAYGQVDELNAVLGWVRAEWARATTVTPEARTTIDAMLHRAQNDLFVVGSDLATLPADRWPDMQRVGPKDASRLEAWIDRLQEDLEPLKEFVLPGGGPVSAAFHLGRTVCRRAEREATSLLEGEPDPDTHTVIFLNRLSDWLFVAGRWAAKEAKESEVLWDRRPTDD